MLSVQCELHYVTLIIHYVALSLQCESAFKAYSAYIYISKEYCCNKDLRGVGNFKTSN